MNTEERDHQLKTGTNNTTLSIRYFEAGRRLWSVTVTEQ